MACLGRICPEKGFDVALRAAHAADVPLLLAGEVFQYTEHQRYFTEAGWSKEQMQEYLWPRLNAPTTSATDRLVNIGRPDGIIIVAAGGPGMGETWLLMPHLAWAITEPIQPPAA